MFGYLFLAVLAAFLLYVLMCAIKAAAIAIMFQGAAIGQAFAYVPSVVRDPKTREEGLVVEQTEIKALFASILDCTRTRVSAGRAPAVDIQYRFLFVLKEDPRFKALPMGEWVATLVEESQAGQDTRTEYCDNDPRKGSTAVGALEGLLQKLKDRKKK